MVTSNINKSDSYDCFRFVKQSKFSGSVRYLVSPHCYEIFCVSKNMMFSFIKNTLITKYRKAYLSIILTFLRTENLSMTMYN